MQQLRIYNTLSRKKEVFKPIRQGFVGFYSCGPTVYQYAHIGNLRTYVFADILKRVLKHAGYSVKHVMNITDVGHLTSDADTGEDKLEKGAAREHKNVWELAEFYTSAFQDDLALLNILPPDVWCKATDHIKEQIKQIEEIENSGFAYVIEDGVYFDTSKLPDYGKLAKLNVDDLQAGARVEVVPGKKHPSDFALWKFSPKHSQRQMEWDSPWGKGFPGWHIECSSMSMKYLGDEFDIHTGGIDHIPVHHTNEIAQAEAAGKRFSHYWMHGEFLVIKDEKMAKSGENFLTLAVLQERGFQPLDYRYLCLTCHYRKQLAFSWEALQGAADAYKSLKNKVYLCRDSTETGDLELKHAYNEQFSKACNDDLNMPEALAVLWNAFGDEKLGGADKYSLSLLFDTVFGLDLVAVGAAPIPEQIMVLVQQREEHRRQRDWKSSDALRVQIADLGYVVQDTSEGPVVRPK